MPFNYGGLEPQVRIELTTTFLPRRQSANDLQRLGRSLCGSMRPTLRLQ